MIELTDREVFDRKGSEVYLDIEIYPNYFLILIMYDDEKVVTFEGTDINRKKLIWILENNRVFTFNGIKFDIPIIFYLLYSFPSVEQLFSAAQDLIFNMMFFEFYKKFNIPYNSIKIFHTDLIELCIGKQSLKMYARTYPHTLYERPAI